MIVCDVTIKLTLDPDGPVSAAAVDLLLTSEWPDWVVGVEIINENTRPATQEEAESMCWEE